MPSDDPQTVCGHSYSICSTLKKSCAKIQLNMSNHLGEKCVFAILFFQRSHNSFKNCRKVTTLELNLYYQLHMAKGTSVTKI